LKSQTTGVPEFAVPVVEAVALAFVSLLHLPAVSLPLERHNVEAVDTTREADLWIRLFFDLDGNHRAFFSFVFKIQ
jgi:hypothetical protein